MTNGVAEVAANPVARQVSDVIAQEVSHGRQMVDMALVWLAENGVAYLFSLAVALLLLAVGVPLIGFVTRATRRALHRALRRSNRPNALLENFVCSVVNKTCWAFLTLIVLQQIGLNIAPLIAGLGVTGFILGFAFQESLGNLAAGMMIALNQPFKVGDYISAGGNEGTVRELNMMATTLTTGDNKKVVIPNKIIWGSAITNFSAMDTRRIQIDVGIAYGADIGKAKAVALAVVGRHPLVLRDPAPVTGVTSLGDSAVVLMARGWVKTGDYWTAYFDCAQAVKEAFDQEGIEIALPQLDVHMR